MATGTDRASFVKLNNHNYVHWAFRMKMVLIERDLWRLVNPDVAAAVGENDQQNAEINANLQKALAVISLNIDDDQLIHVQGAQDGRVAWISLRNIHQRNTIGSKIRLLSRLFRTRMSAGESMQCHLNKMSEILSQLSSIGAEGVDEQVAVCAVMQSVSDEYDSLITAMEAWTDERLTLANVLSMLLEEWERRNEKEKAETAFGATDGGRPAKQRKFMCYWCDGSGHIKRNCALYKQYLEERNAEQAPHQQGGNRVDGNKRKDNKDSARVARMNQWYSDFCIDSGASSHLCNQLGLFNNYTEVDSREVFLADGNSVVILGKGSVDLKIYPKNSSPMNVTIHDVLYVPDLEENLISVRRLNEKGLDVLFSGGNCFLVKGKQRSLIAEFSHGMFRILTQPPDKVSSVSDERARCIHQWHKILAHRNLPDIQLMGRQGLAIRKCHCDVECESCLKGKMSRKPFQLSRNLPTEILECVASDLGGPLQVRSLGHSIYYITFTDLLSGYCEVVPMKSKSETPQCVKRFIEKMKNLTGKNLKVFRTDRGKEYLNKSLQDYLADNGIQHQCTTGYCPEQNGVAERQNRTLMEATRTVLADSGLPMSFWAEALKYTAFVNNRIVNRKHSKSPLELMFGTKPNYDDMYPFGARVYVHVPGQKRQKLDCKGKKGIYVGHDELSKGYRIADPDTYAITVSRDVKFRKGHVSKLETNFIEFESKFKEEIQEESESDDDDETSDETTGDEEEDEFESSESSEEEFFDVDEPVLRRSTRSNIGQPPKRFNDYYVYSAKQSTPYEPKNYKQAIECPDREKWMKAMQEELDSIERNHTWEMTDLPVGRASIGSKWVFKVKLDQLGQPAVYKARLVAQGFTQKFGVDYDEVFAPVARSETFRTLLTVAGSRKMKVRQFDFKTAFLNGTLEEEIYLRQPPGFENGKKVLRLRKSLYGLKQAAKVWNDAVHGALLKCGCVQSSFDHCLYSKCDESSELYLIIHVDDLLVASNDEQLITSVMNRLKSVFELKDLGEASHYLGIDITRDRSGVFSICQSRYIDKIIDEAGLTNAKDSKYPIDPGYYKLNDDVFLASNDEYRKLIGMLLYLSINTRPDIAASVAILSQKISKPSQKDLTEVKRIIRYIKGTRNLELKLGGGKLNEIVAFSDANWAEDRTDRKSNSGYIIFVNGGVIAWCCRKQNLVTLSSCEAEYVALCETAKELIWLRNLVRDFGIQIEGPINIKTDSQSAMAMTSNQKLNNRSKHIDIRFHFIKDMVEQKQLQLEYVPTEDNQADMLTKPLGSVKLKHLRVLAGVQIEEEC